MSNFASDAMRVAWIDFRFIRRNIPTVLVTSLVAPLLYLFAFGYGLGNGMETEGVDYISFMIPGIIAMSTLTSCFSNVATKVMLQRTYYQSFDELFLCSIGPSAIIIGKAVSGAVRGLISCAVLYALGLFLAGDVMLTAGGVLMILFSCFMYGLLGVICGLLSNSHLTLNMFNSLVVLPMTFLCGTIFSLDNLDGTLQGLISILPLTQTTSCTRAAMLGWDFPWLSLLILVAWCALFFLASRYLIVKGRARQRVHNSRKKITDKYRDNNRPSGRWKC